MLAERTIISEHSIETVPYTFVDGRTCQTSKYHVWIEETTSKRKGTYYHVGIANSNCDILDGNYCPITDLAEAQKLYNAIKEKYPATYVTYDDDYDAD